MTWFTPISRCGFQFVVEFDRADCLAATHADTLRTAVTGWGVDPWPTSISGDLQQMGAGLGTYRDPFDKDRSSYRSGSGSSVHGMSQTRSPSGTRATDGGTGSAPTSAVPGS